VPTGTTGKRFSKLSKCKPIEKTLVSVANSPQERNGNPSYRTVTQRSSRRGMLGLLEVLPDLA
jgi:hypothetical protein